LLTDRQTNKNRQKHYLLGGGNYSSSDLVSASDFYGVVEAGLFTNFYLPNKWWRIPETFMLLCHLYKILIKITYCVILV